MSLRFPDSRIPAPAVFSVAALLLLLAAALPEDARGEAESTRPPAPGLYRLADLNGFEASGLNREKTFVLQPLGMIHTHGPHLPSGTDMEIVNALVDRIAEALRAERPEYSVLILPNVPAGAGASNELGHIYNHAGSMSVSQKGLRQFLVEWIFNTTMNAFWNFYVVSFHHDPSHMAAISDVCDYYSDTYGMRTLNVSSLVLADPEFAERAGRIAADHLGEPGGGIIFSLHGGAAETSLMLELRPEAVASEYATLPAFPVTSYKELTDAARRNGWPGYFGAPSRATKEFGRDLMDALVEAHVKLIVDAADGGTWRDRPNVGDALKQEYNLRERLRATTGFRDHHFGRFDRWLKIKEEKEKLARESGG